MPDFVKLAWQASALLGPEPRHSEVVTLLLQVQPDFFFAHTRELISLSKDNTE